MKSWKPKYSLLPVLRHQKSSTWDPLKQDRQTFCNGPDSSYFQLWGISGLCHLYPALLQKHESLPEIQKQMGVAVHIQYILWMDKIPILCDVPMSKNIILLLGSFQWFKDIRTLFAMASLTTPSLWQLSSAGKPRTLSLCFGWDHFWESSSFSPPKCRSLQR